MKPIIFNQNAASINSYLLKAKNECIVIDPGFNGQEILDYIVLNQLKLSKVLLTHGHYDHIRDIRKLSVSHDFVIYIHEDDFAALKDDKLNYSTFFGGSFRLKDNQLVVTLKQNDQITFDDEIIKLIHTPGHTMGSSCFSIGKMIFTGDTLFQGDLGRTDLLGGSQKMLEKSIFDLFQSCSNEMIVYPGHEQTSTIGQERKNNLSVLRILKTK